MVQIKYSKSKPIRVGSHRAGNNMIKVKLSTTFPEEPLIRQTPGLSGIWGNCRFIINDYVDECDYWVVVDGAAHNETTTCPPQHTIFITSEPPAIKRYDPDYLSQFALVVTTRPDVAHPHVIYSQPGLPWHVGRILTGAGHSTFNKDYDEFKRITRFKKNKLISVISSSKAFTEGHRARLQFVGRLQQHFGAQIDVFGRGIWDIDDKWDAVSPYKYHIALENSSLPHYWTEKLGDAYLAGAYPIYYGCPNLVDYFPDGSYTSMDINDEDNAIRIIEQCIRENRYENSRDKIMAARNLVLDKYNLFPMIVNLIQTFGMWGQEKKRRMSF